MASFPGLADDVELHDLSGSDDDSSSSEALSDYAEAELEVLLEVLKWPLPRLPFAGSPPPPPNTSDGNRAEEGAAG